MKLLLDTHVFIWWDGEPRKLPKRVLDACVAVENQVLLSIASIWEMQIKLGLGKLKMLKSLPQVIESQQIENGLEILPIKLLHLWSFGDLSPLHGDPFDRMLVAQARIEQAKLVSKDQVFTGYPVELFW
jgi:PIN domain nuclease of toxin-antitoxin system